MVQISADWDERPHQETKAAFEELLAACRPEAELAQPALETKPVKKPTQSPEQAKSLAVPERKLTEHKGWIRSAAVSPDGTWAASGSDDRTVKVWDLETCIAEDTPQGRHLVFPSQYRREKDIPWDPGVFVSYTFSGEWQTVWTTLVVRLWYSQEFEHKELWRNAAEFQSSRGHLLGLKIDNRQGEGQATISLFFDMKTPDELKVIFIEYVHRHLAKYGCDVTRDRRYVCPECEQPVTNLDAVRRRLAAGKGFITCQECDEQVPLIDFIEQRLKSDPVARKILSMEETATRELDTQALEQILIGHMMAVCGEAKPPREFPRLCRGGSRSLTFPGVSIAATAS